ncbi:MAG: hypothetical protein JWO42_3898, partial [Chloroflexi bacterium]|nr:hypothetical protein [Chloroflexota bacterium]
MALLAPATPQAAMELLDFAVPRALELGADTL